MSQSREARAIDRLEGEIRQINAEMWCIALRGAQIDRQILVAKEELRNRPVPASL